MTEPSLGERFERSPAMQILIGVVIVAILLAQAAMHLPSRSALADEVGPSANYLVRLLGVEQQWGVFAPDPRSTSIKIEGRVTFADGSTAVWHLPQGARIGANLRYYRWRKWLERVRSDDFRILWEPTAAWIASEYDDGPSPVARVQLVRSSRDNALVGEQPPYEETVYFTYVPEDAR